MENVTCKEFIDSMVEQIFLSGQVSDAQLKKMLQCRDDGVFKFVLIDIREVFEYTDKSIVGCDKLLPTSTLHIHLDKLEMIKDQNIVLYCRTGSRTGQMLAIMKRMGFKFIAHLSDGIVAYSGETKKNAPLPN